MKVNRGDTLIEVLFAFVILATIVGFAFSGAIHAWKVSMNAQERTQATLVAQYYADGLKTYRDSIGWSVQKDGLVGPTFLDGGGDGFSAPLPGMVSYINGPGQFCMELIPAATGPQNWEVETVLENCSSYIKSTLAPNLQSPQVAIILKAATMPNPDQVTATVTVSWLPGNTNTRESVVNTIILAAER